MYQSLELLYYGNIILILDLSYFAGVTLLKDQLLVENKA